MVDLVPEVYRANEGEKEQNDNKILAVALRYKYYTDLPVIFITDDRSLANKASGEGLEVWTAKDFLMPPENSFEEEDNAVIENTGTESIIAGGEAKIEPEATEAERCLKAREEYLAQKISTKLLRLEASQISVLQNNGIKTLADFLARTETDFAQMKVKKGIPFTAKYLKEQEAIKRRLEGL